MILVWLTEYESGFKILVYDSIEMDSNGYPHYWIWILLSRIWLWLVSADLGWWTMVHRRMDDEGQTNHGDQCSHEYRRNHWQTDRLTDLILVLKW